MKLERIPLDWNQLRRVGVLHRSFWLGWFELSGICTKLIYHRAGHFGPDPLARNDDALSPDSSSGIRWPASGAA